MAVTATVTVTESGTTGSGNVQWAIGSIAVSGTYVTGGFTVPIPSGSADMERIAWLDAKGSGRLLEWDASAQLLKVKAWATAGATVAASEITNGTDIGAADTGGYTFYAIGQ
jgi:hypothetical protein